MAVSMRAKMAASTGVARAAPKSRMVVCQAQGENAGFAKAQIAAAALAAAALVSAPAHAGVVLQQPELKKVFQNDGTPAPVKERPFRQPGAAPAVKESAPVEEAKPKVDEEPLSDGGLDPRVVALPGAVIAIGALGFAASKIDNGFSEWINESGALVRNSGAFAGFETDIKDDNYQSGRPIVATKAGTKKVGTTKTGTKKVQASGGGDGPLGALGNLFGKK